MDFLKAKRIANRIMETLEPFCDKISIAGSVRRDKKFPKDIEIVCVPHTQGKRRNVSFCKEGFGLGKIVKGTLGGKYCKIHLNQFNICLDLFMVEPENYGMQLLIRTGPAAFSKKILRQFNFLGYKSSGGYPIKGKKKLCFYKEQEVFDFLDLIFVQPSERM